MNLWVFCTQGERMTTVIAVTGIDPDTGKPYTILASDTQGTLTGYEVVEEWGRRGVQRYARPVNQKQEFSKLRAPEGMHYAIGFAGAAPGQLAVRDPSEFDNVPMYPWERKALYRSAGEAKDLVERCRQLLGEKPVPQRERQGFEDALYADLDGKGGSSLVDRLNRLQRSVAGDEGSTVYLLARDFGDSHALYYLDRNGKAKRIDAQGAGAAIGSGERVAVEYIQQEGGALLGQHKGRKVLFAKPEDALRLVVGAVRAATEKDLFSSGLDVVVMSDGKRVSYRKDIEQWTDDFRRTLGESLEKLVEKETS